VTHGRRRRARLLSPLVAAVVLSTCTLRLQAADRFVGRVVSVQDGDTISVMRGGRAERVRLDGIDAPERRQEFGSRAKQFLSEIVFGEIVTVDVRDRDRYGRTVGRVFVRGRDAGLEVVRAGLAWHFTRYSSDALLASAERDARSARRGLWTQSAPVPPWEFRHPGTTGPAVTARAERASGLYHGNLRSHVFHAPGCKDYDCPNCRAGFASASDARAAGYRAHAACVH
jgi:endonuclease YncB( thermonuclease family)